MNYAASDWHDIVFYYHFSFPLASILFKAYKHLFEVLYQCCTRFSDTLYVNAASDWHIIVLLSLLISFRLCIFCLKLTHWFTSTLGFSFLKSIVNATKIQLLITMYVHNLHVLSFSGLQSLGLNQFSQNNQLITLKVNMQMCKPNFCVSSSHVSRIR